MSNDTITTRLLATFTLLDDGIVHEVEVREVAAGPIENASYIVTLGGKLIRDGGPWVNETAEFATGSEAMEFALEYTGWR